MSFFTACHDFTVSSNYFIAEPVKNNVDIMLNSLQDVHLCFNNLLSVDEFAIARIRSCVDYLFVTVYLKYNHVFSEKQQVRFHILCCLIDYNPRIMGYKSFAKTTEILTAQQVRN
jgi:hypothetical protein